MIMEIIRINAPLTRPGRKEKRKAFIDNKRPIKKPIIGKYKRDAPKSSFFMLVLILTGSMVKN
jgi:hypothetical protein